MTVKPSQPAAPAPTPAAGADASAKAANHSPSEVGWMFVSEYYHTMNKDPSRLHLFYGKNSAAIHGVEAAHTDAAYGQAEIQKLIAAQNFNQPRVVISSVDSLLAIEGGVVVQVLGELSNAGGPSNKFVQTFFLAKQPAGYFVLNDMLRYLCEDMDEDTERPMMHVGMAASQSVSEPAAAAPAFSAPAPVAADKPKPKSREPSPAKPKSPERRPASPARDAEVAAPEEPKPRALSPVPTPAPAPVAAEQKPKSREPSPKRAKSPAKPAAEPVAEPKPETVKPAAAAAAAQPRAKSPEKQAAPKPAAAPAKPATWANLIASSTTSSSSPAPASAAAAASPRSQSPAVSAAVADAQPTLRPVESAAPAASAATTLVAMQVYGSPGMESQQQGGRNPNFHTDTDKSVYVRLPYPAFENATPEFIVSSLPAGVTVKAITYQRMAAVLHLGSADEARSVLGHKLTLNGQTTSIEVRRESGGAGGRGGYGGQGYRGGYQGGRGGYQGNAQGGARPGSSGGMPRSGGFNSSSQQAGGDFGGRGGSMGGRGRGRGAPPTRA